MIRFVTFLLVVIVSSLSLAKADETLSSKGIPCATLKEVLVHYDAQIDWMESVPNIINIKSGASFHIIMTLRGAYTSHNTVLYRPVSVGLTDYCNFMEVYFQYPDLSNPDKISNVGDTFPASFYYQKNYIIWGEPEVEINYDNSTDEVGYFKGANSQAYDYISLDWKFDPLKAKFNLVEYKERRTGEMVSGSRDGIPNLVIDFSVTPPLWRHLLITETQKLRALMESAKRYRIANVEFRLAVCNDPIKRADYEDYCKRLSD